MDHPGIKNICDELLSFIKANILDSAAIIEPDTPFSEAGLDSMSIIEIVLFIERKYGVSITERDLTVENLKSARSLAECTFKHL